MRAVCGRVRTAVLLSYPSIIPHPIAFVNTFFEKNLPFFKLFSTPFPTIFTVRQNAENFDADDIFCRMTNRIVKNVIRKFDKKLSNICHKNLTFIHFDEIFGRYSSLLIIYKSQVLLYNIGADKTVSPRPAMPALFLAQYFVTAKYQAHDIPPCGVGHCCASFLCKFFRKIK